MEKVKIKIDSVKKIQDILATLSLEPLEINNFLDSIQSSPLINRQKALQVLLRPNISLSGLTTIPKIKAALQGYTREAIEQAEIQIKYETYIQKEKELVSKISQLEELIIPDTFVYDKLSSLSNEARQKFNKIRPRTLGQASRISGVNPSDVQILMVYMGR